MNITPIFSSDLGSSVDWFPRTFRLPCIKEMNCQNTSIVATRHPRKARLFAILEAAFIDLYGLAALWREIYRDSYCLGDQQISFSDILFGQSFTFIFVNSLRASYKQPPIFMPAEA